MGSQQQSLLHLPPVGWRGGLSGAGSGLLAGADPTFVADYRGMRYRAGLQMQAELVMKEKAHLANELMGELHQNAIHQCAETAQVICQVTQEAQGTDYEEYMVEFANRFGGLVAQQILGSLRVVGTAIAREMARSPYPPPPSLPPPPPQRTWLGRKLLGDT